MAKIETTFDLPRDADSPTVTEITLPVCLDAFILIDDVRRKSLTARVACIQTALDCGFVLHDELLLRHAADLTRLMEAAWERFLDTGSDELRDIALSRMRQRDAARRLLSPLQFDPGEFPF